MIYRSVETHSKTVNDTCDIIWIVGKPAVVLSIVQLVLAEVLFIWEELNHTWCNRTPHLVQVPPCLHQTVLLGLVCKEW